MNIRLFSRIALALFCVTLMTSCETVSEWKDKITNSGDDNKKDKMSKDEQKAFDAGKKLGKADAKDGKKSDYKRHDDDYDKKTEKFFKKGYEEGFKKAKD